MRKRRPRHRSLRAPFALALSPRFFALCQVMTIAALALDWAAVAAAALLVGRSSPLPLPPRRGGGGNGSEGLRAAAGAAAALFSASRRGEQQQVSSPPSSAAVEPAATAAPGKRKATKAMTTAGEADDDREENGEGVGGKERWDRMLSRLEAFRLAHGHACVPPGHPDRELSAWTRAVRASYRHQALGAAAADDDEKKAAPLAGGAGGDEEGEEEARFFGAGRRRDRKAKKRERTYRVRPRLSELRLGQLREAGFVWDVQDHQWEAKYLQLRRFWSSTGHCRVPNNCPDYPQLGVWVRNQRREHRRLLALGGERAGAGSGTSRRRSTLTPERLRKLEALGFEWYRSHEDGWGDRYRELRLYRLEHGHANVPQRDPSGLGRWCMNQRVARRKLARQQQQIGNTEGEDCDGRGGPAGDQSSASASLLSSPPSLAMTPSRIERLEGVGFAWHVREMEWRAMLDRLAEYHREHGHVNLAPGGREGEGADGGNDETELLRRWLIRQRYEYGRLRDGLPSPMTPERARMIEAAIPGFRWKVRGGGAPTKADWAKLFAAMRAKGLQPGMRAKSHWFEGTDRFGGGAGPAVSKDVWTEQDLLALWNQESDDDDEDDDYGHTGAEKDECVPR